MKHRNQFSAEKRTVWFRGHYVPILSGTGRKNLFASEEWIARGTTQRVGASILAAGFFCGSIALFVASLLLTAKTSHMVGGVLGYIFGLGLSVLAFLVGCTGMFLTFRLVRGIVRSFYRVHPTPEA